jgi:hypothetical protein
MSTVFNRLACVTIIQKRLKKTLTNAKTAYVPFEDQPTKELKIP